MRGNVICYQIIGHRNEGKALEQSADTIIRYLNMTSFVGNFCSDIGSSGRVGRGIVILCINTKWRLFNLPGRFEMHLKPLQNTWLKLANTSYLSSTSTNIDIVKWQK